MLNLNKTVMTILIYIVNKVTSHSHDPASSFAQDTANQSAHSKTEETAVQKWGNGVWALQFLRPDMNDTWGGGGYVTRHAERIQLGISPEAGVLYQLSLSFEIFC